VVGECAFMPHIYFRCRLFFCPFGSSERQTLSGWTMLGSERTPKFRSLTPAEDRSQGMVNLLPRGGLVSLSVGFRTSTRRQKILQLDDDKLPLAGHAESLSFFLTASLLRNSCADLNFRCLDYWRRDCGRSYRSWCCRRCCGLKKQLQQQFRRKEFIEQ
jgi:hypothetical protein